MIYVYLFDSLEYDYFGSLVNIDDSLDYDYFEYMVNIDYCFLLVLILNLSFFL